MSASPAVFPWPEIALLSRSPDDLLRECERQPYQASGPGGQKRNRTYAAMRLVHPSGYRASAGEFREPARNLALALRRLRRAVALGLVGVELDALLREPDPPAALARALEAWPAFRYPVNEQHDDLPTCIARAVLALRLAEGQTGPAARWLGVSGSALVKFCKGDGELWRFLQELRKRSGLAPLR